MISKDSLCIALDGSDRSWILSTARALGNEVGWLKIGLEAFIAHGPALVEEVAAACRRHGVHNLVGFLPDFGTDFFEFVSSWCR